MEKMMNGQKLNNKKAPTRRSTETVILASMFAAIVSLLWYSSSMAADLFGTVQRSGKPADGVVVKLQPASTSVRDREKQATTNTAGQYVIREIVPGKYKLICDDKEQALIDIGSGINRRNCNL
ncbi:MAG: carboxypeptidase-like regulatory domain-containing protein [Desulfobacterales bacterium]|jgi:hypothetical protein|nr:carboxypeptidase-like regulatory domain-containing protein [Desulfobacterales bacterium]